MTRSRELLGMIGMCIMLVMTGCENGGGGDDSNPSVDVSGHWTGKSSTGISFTIDLTQAGKNVSGKTKAGGELGVMTGSVAGNTFTFSTIWAYSPKDNGTATVTGNTMTGSIKNSAGQGASFVANR